MKLDRFDLLEDDRAHSELKALLSRFNDVSTTARRRITIHDAFAACAARAPEATAVGEDGRTLTYRELDERSNRLARVLAAHGVGLESVVAVACDSVVDLSIALLGVLKVGAAYCPIDGDLPYDRARYLLEETRATAIVSQRRFIRRLNQLQWDCRDLSLVIGLDSEELRAEIEPLGEKMRREMWDYVGQTMVDDISGGGWQSSFTGDWLSRGVMDDYGENARLKLSPLVDQSSSVLEIGCASGITMFRLAPLVGAYLGTDLSPEILAWSEREAVRRSHHNISLRAMPAHDVHTLAPRRFDVVVINSVLQCFSGHNYLRTVIRDLVGLMHEEGAIFLGNVFDQDLKDAFLGELAAYHRAHPTARTKTDYSEELFINRAFLEDLRHDIPEIADIDCSPLIGTHESELSRFSFDALLRVDRTRRSRAPLSNRHKHQLDARALRQEPTTPIDAKATPETLAYVMYTSGTSGKPKGVLVEHKSVTRLVLEPSFVTLDAQTRMLMTGAVAFDASTFEIWGALLNGGALYRTAALSIVDPGELRARIEAWRINTMWLTATLFNQLTDADPRTFSGLRFLLVGGERLSPMHVNAVRRALPGLVLINGYGPTENTTFTTCHRIDGDARGDIPIGRPIAGTEVLILDEANRPVPIGIPGEICAAGDGLARGYLHDDALTAARFPAHPWMPAARMYRTGDRGRWRADGVVEYLGRIDEQVKVRGYRIEPAEIEHAIRAFPGSLDACVIALEADSPGAARELAGYVAGPVDAGALRAHLKGSIPEYMVPAHLVVLDRLPMTANGKVDRRKLPRPRRTGAGAAVVTETEREVSRIWEEVLGAGNVGATDNFFELGGHSLKVTKVVSLVEQRLGVRLPLAAVFRAATVRDLSAYLVHAAGYGLPLADDVMVTIRNGSRAVFALPPGTGDVLAYLPLAPELPDTRLHAFNFIDDDDRLERYADLIEAAERPPYVLLGYSSGGNLAFHVAVELERRGHAVAEIVMLDSGRRVRPYPYLADEVHAAAQTFLQHENIRPYCNTPPLRDKVVRRIEAFYRFLASTIDEGRIGASISVIVGDGAPTQVHHGGELIADVAGWQEATSGELTIHQGAGDHQHMLMEPALSANATLLRRILGRSVG